MNGDNDQVRRMQSLLQQFEFMLNDQIRRVQSLLEHFEPLLAEEKARRQQTAERFDVFEALRVDGYEMYHSRFIAYLLNPIAHHDQGDAFLNSFLKCLGLNFCPTSVRGASVETEAGLDSYGRIDIRIRLANGQIILIENKVDAQEDHCQLARYQKWLQRQDAPPKFPHQLVFLTPEGRRPESTRRPEKVICLSYLRLADWMASSHQWIAAARCRGVLKQYEELCRRIGGNGRDGGIDMTDGIRQFFLDPDEPERLETALEIEKQLSAVKRELHETFWREAVQEMLTARLNNDPSWEVRFDDDLFQGFNFGRWKGWQIAWRDRRNRPHFAVRVEFWPSQGTMFFGIARGIEKNAADIVQPDRDIRNRLHGQGFSRTESSYWPGYQLSHNRGLPRFDLSVAEDVLALHRERLNADRPLTRQVVDSIWELFCDFRQELEALNRNYPYDPPADANA